MKLPLKIQEERGALDELTLTIFDSDEYEIGELAVYDTGDEARALEDAKLIVAAVNFDGELRDKVTTLEAEVVELRKRRPSSSVPGAS